MLYLTLEKIPELTGLGPWMGVVQEEEQVTSDYPEEKKVLYASIVLAVESDKKRPTSVVSREMGSNSAFVF